MNHGLKAALAVTLFTALGMACAENSPVAPSSSAAGFSAAITCQASVKTASLSCGRATPTGTPAATTSAERQVILGGQGTYVQLASDSTAYDGVSAFTSKVTVTNLTAQPMNTADGTTPDSGGVKVFFASGPTVTGGEGTVTVGNPDGTGTFIATAEPFFEYSRGSVLGSGVTSVAKTWLFALPNTVTSFSFTVYLLTKLPADSSVLLWTLVSTSPTTQQLNAVTSYYAVGDSGTVLFFNGSSWTAVNTGIPSLSNINLYGLNGLGSSPVVVGDSGVVLETTGCCWTRTQVGGGNPALMSVSSIPGYPDSLFAVGVGGAIFFYDGASWMSQTSGTTDTLFVTGGSSYTNWFAAGAGGTLLHWNGSAWTALNSQTTADLYGGAVAGTSPGVLTDLWEVGGGGVITHSGDGGATFALASSGTSTTLQGLQANSQTDAFAVGQASTILHWNGTTWSSQATPSSSGGPPPTLKAVNYNNSWPPDVWAVGTGGTILHGTRAADQNFGSPGAPHTYATTFPLTENPISEGSNWTNATPGSNPNVQTAPGFAFGTWSGTSADPIAVLTGTWNPNQQAEGTVKVDTAEAACCHEVEVHLRMTTVDSVYQGYEILCSVVPSYPYIGIVKWNPDGTYNDVAQGTGTACADGDVLKATVIGSTITAYVNGTQELQGTDSTYTSGNPGMGFYETDSNVDYFGFKSFMACAN